MALTLPIWFRVSQLWLRHVRDCGSWRYRFAFDDPHHQGQAKHVFEGQLWAKNEEHAVQVQRRINDYCIVQLQREYQAADKPNSWMGLRYDPSTKTGFWPVRTVAGVRNVANSMQKGWSPGGLKPGLLLRLVYHDLFEKLDHKIEQIQKHSSVEQVIGNLALMLVFCMCLSLGALVMMIMSALHSVTLSWGVLYAGIFVTVTFGLLSYGLVIRLQVMLKEVRKHHE